MTKRGGYGPFLLQLGMPLTDIVVAYVAEEPGRTSREIAEDVHGWLDDPAATSVDNIICTVTNLTRQPGKYRLRREGGRYYLNTPPTCSRRTG